MPTLAEIVGKMQTVTVKVRGREIVLTAMSAFDLATMRRMFPRPIAPQLPDPSKGTGAALVAGTWDPKYNRDLEEWRHKVTAVEVAMAMGLTTSSGKSFGGDDANAKAWADEAVAEITKAFTTIEINMMAQEIDGASQVTRLEDESRKNS